MQIISGIQNKATKCVCYGPEGIGKSTFASQAPDPLFIDTEDSTLRMNVKRLPKPTSSAMILEEIRYVRDTPGICSTLVMDTADWAERLCRDAVCARYHKAGLEDFGYGKGYEVTHGVTNMDSASLRVEWTTEEWTLPHVNATESLYVSGVDTAQNSTKLVVKSDGNSNWGAGRTFYFYLTYCKT